MSHTYLNKNPCRDLPSQVPIVLYHERTAITTFTRENVNKYRKLSKWLSKKTKGSKGYEKARFKIAKFYVKLKYPRIDFLPKLSTKMSVEMSVKTKQLF